MKKNGFTLIELLAVIVILAVIMLVKHMSSVWILGDAEKGAFRTEFIDFLNSAQVAAQMDIMNGKISAGNPKRCYTYTELTEDYGYYTAKDGYNGSVQVIYNNGDFEIHGWLSSSKYIASNKDKNLTTDDISDSNGATASTDCT